MGCHSQHHHERLNQAPQLPACTHPCRGHTSASAASSEPAPFSDHLEEPSFNLPRSDVAPLCDFPRHGPFLQTALTLREHTLHTTGPAAAGTTYTEVWGRRGVLCDSLYSPGTRAGPAWAQRHHAVGSMCSGTQRRVKYHMQSQAG